MARDEPFKGREVRLFPSLHIRGDREAEQRATASLLAVLRAVSEYGRLVVRRLGGPAGRLTCFTEVSLELPRRGEKPDKLRLDGVIHVKRGKTRWTALVETKVGGNELNRVQIDKYHRLAGQHGLDALITISNQPARADGLPPVNLDGRRLRAVPVAHFSWERLLSEAQVLSRKKAVSDPDQKWMLDEWIRYVDDPASRIILPPDLGSHWGDVVRAARTGSLRRGAPELREVAEKWVGFVDKAALRLRAQLGVDVRAKVSRAERRDPRLGIDKVVEQADVNSVLNGALVIPDAVGNVSIEVFLHSQTVRYGVRVRAPSRGRQLTRVRWLARQLRKLPDLPTGLRVNVRWARRGLRSSAGADEVRESASVLLVDSAGVAIPRNVMPRSFSLRLSSSIPRLRGRSSSRVLAAVSAGVEEFYRSVVEGLVPWVPPAPRLPEKEVPEPERAAPLDQQVSSVLPTSPLEAKSEDDDESVGEAGREHA